MKKTPPDLLLLDVSMPGVDGREICAELKNNKFVRHLPIIMMSAHHDLKTMATQAGADDFITKPFDISTLLEKIKRHLVEG